MPSRSIAQATSSRGLRVCRGVSLETLTGLSRDDIDVVDKVWAEYGQMHSDELVLDVHHKLDEWLDHWHDSSRRSQSVPVPYDTLYRTVVGLDAADAADVAGEVAYFQAMGDAKLGKG